MSEFQKALDKYAKYVIQQSRSNLTKAGKGKGPLYNTLSYKIAGSRVTFLSEKYGIFVDKGVKGDDPSKVSPNARIKGQQAPNSPYEFGSGKFKGSWDDFVDKMTEFRKTEKTFDSVIKTPANSQKAVSNQWDILSLKTFIVAA